VWDRHEGPIEPRLLAPRPLTPVDADRRRAASLVQHATLCFALTRGVLSEVEARWRTMSRAHDAADRRIQEQERELRKVRQESITQEMLEVRRARGSM
jgi:F0F1-type ATP synthase gamma subunit